MPLEQRPQEQPPTNEELLQQAERYFGFARRNYGRDEDGNEYAVAAANIAQAAAAIVIARVLNQQGVMPEAEVPKQVIPTEG